MVDITLSTDRIRTAPPEVRRWIENELAASLGMNIPERPPAHHEQLVTCSIEEVGQIFDFLKDMPPVLNVLLELGRTARSLPPGNIVVTTLHEIADHAHLQATPQVMTCLKIINEALQQLKGDDDALLCAVDDEERCYVAATTQTHIREVWQAIVAAHSHAFVANPVSATCAPPYAVGPVSAPPEAAQDQVSEQVETG